METNQNRSNNSKIIITLKVFAVVKWIRDTGFKLKAKFSCFTSKKKLNIYLIILSLFDLHSYVTKKFKIEVRTRILECF